MNEEANTTIQLKKSVVKELNNIKKHPRQSYNEVICELIKIAKKSQTRHYDDFIHKIQQAKMQELWDNAEDEAWENA